MAAVLLANSNGSPNEAVPTDNQNQEQNTSTWKKLYKTRSYSSDQEDRRKRLLEIQKKKRKETFNSSRQIEVLSPDGELEEQLEEEEKDEAEDMECTVVTKKKWRPRKYADVLMHSEWMMDVPPDLENQWFFVPCPAGKRCLVIAEQKSTRAYSSSGNLLASFESLLPGGGRSSTASSRTLLDCVWSWRAQTYYVLDVLAWGNQPFSDCEVEFRACWLKSKLEELDEISEIKKGNKFKFVPLPFRMCSSIELSNAMQGPPPFSDVMDGVLFYHREAHYTPGPSPLVVWLLPFMLPEVLGVDVSEPLSAQQPANYPGHLEFVQQFQSQDRRQRREQYRQRKAASRAVLQCNDVDSSMDAHDSEDEGRETVKRDEEESIETCDSFEG